MKLGKFLKRTSEYEAEFAQLDFEDDKKLSKLARRIADDLKIVDTAIEKNERHLQRIRASLDTHQQRTEQLRKSEQEIAQRIEASSERNFDDERQLYRVQFQIKATAREKKDYLLTRDSLRQWLLDLDRAKSLLEMMQSSLQRNMDRLGVDTDADHEISRVVGVITVPDIHRVHLSCPGCDCGISDFRVWHRNKTCPKCGVRLRISYRRDQLVAYHGDWPGWPEIDAYVGRSQKAKRLVEALGAYGASFDFNKARAAVLFKFKEARPPGATANSWDAWSKVGAYKAIEQLTQHHGLSFGQSKRFVQDMLDDIIQEVMP